MTRQRHWHERFTETATLLAYSTTTVSLAVSWLGQENQVQRALPKGVWRSGHRSELINVWNT